MHTLNKTNEKYSSLVLKKQHKQHSPNSPFINGGTEFFKNGSNGVWLKVLWLNEWSHHIWCAILLNDMVWLNWSFSKRGFEFSRLNSLLSQAFSRQNKKIKINRIINGSVTFRSYESYLDTLNNELSCLCSSFLYRFFPFNSAR